MAIKWNSDSKDPQGADMVRVESQTSNNSRQQIVYSSVDGNANWPRRKRTNIVLTACIIGICIIVAIYFILRESKTPTPKKNDELVPPDVEEELPASYSHFHVFKKGAVCTDGPPCSSIGKEIFDKNGSAVDATIAAMFCNGIVNMQSMGIGGGFLMTIYKRDTKQAFTLNARETAPLKATEDMFKDNVAASKSGPLAIGVPGELRGYWEAHKKFGILPWKDLIEPTIRLCDTGFNMSKVLYDGVKSVKSTETDKNLRESFYDEDTQQLKKGGSLIKPSKALCNTLRAIAEKGGDELYNGTLSDMFIEDLKEIGSIITKEDLEKYRAKWTDPISVPLAKDGILYSVPPPGSGALLGFALNVLAGYNFNKDSINGVNNTVLTYHRIIEAFKYTYAKRTYLGDADFVDVEKMIKNLTSLEYANSIRMLINDSGTYDTPAHYGAHFFNQPDHGTAHVSILAPNGDAVSVTSTVNFYFGVGITSKNTGIVLNNGMDDFSSAGFVNYFGVPGSPANTIKPGKRPMSSMSPSVIVDNEGDVKMVIGASGGTKITTAIAMVIIRSLWFEQTIKEAVDAPRIHHQMLPNVIAYEYGNLKQVIDGLQSLGHKTKRYGDRGSIICALFKNETAIYANADYRKGGDVFGLD